MSRRFAAVLLMAALVACGGGDGEIATSTTDPPVASTRPGGDTQVCSAPEAGYRVEFPDGWHTNDRSSAPACRFFHPEPFNVPTETEATGIAIALQMENVSFNRIAPEGDTRAATVVNRRETTAADHRALRVETVSTGAALLPEDTRGVSYYVDFGSRTLVASTFETAAAGTFRGNTEVLDGMMATLAALNGDQVSCSAAGLSASVPAQAELPTAVAATRRAILDAALACNYDALGRLALSGDRTFTFSFGEQGEPAEFWRRAEARGDSLLRTLVEVLSLPSSSRTSDTTTQYVWPSAYAYQSWDEIPAAARDALRRIYDDEDLRRFQEFGAYVGHRVGIVASGEWIFFVAGD